MILCFLVGTEQLPLAKVQAAIIETRADWYSLAVELNIDYGTRKVRGIKSLPEVHVLLKLLSQAIEKDHSSVEERFHAMLKHWVQRTSLVPSWSALVRALQSPTIERGKIVAKEINLMPVRIPYGMQISVGIYSMLKPLIHMI